LLPLAGQPFGQNDTDFRRFLPDFERMSLMIGCEYTQAPSIYRIMNYAPPIPRWGEAKALIENVIADRELIAFHVTRLIDFQHVRKDGLMMLNLEQHVARLKGHLRDADAIDELAEVDAAVSKMLNAYSFFTNREDAVWATLYRASLHDGGCDVLYESVGREAIERIVGYAGGKLERRLKQIGTPAVVIIRYPACRLMIQPSRFRERVGSVEIHLRCCPLEGRIGRNRP
jgi:hypothetical protein